VISRDASGRATIRAVRLTAPLRIDGQLDEELYRVVPAISDFIQMEPREGAPATEKTEVWLAFDRENVYVSARCWETQPDRLIARDMRRDSNVIFREGNDAIGFMLDTFYDRRSGFIFNINPIGGRTDGQFASERQYTGDWNPVWEVQVGRFEQGWTLEAAIPFKSIRYRPGDDQVWGFNVRRTNGWKNELSFITRMPTGRGTGATQLASLAATVVGIDAPGGFRNLEIKPYAVSNATSDRTPGLAPTKNLGAAAGVDVKYGVTHNLTADFTYNTDFAQVEADEQQVNLTRFSLLFPEKREFFLENQGTFVFGGAGAGSFGGASDTPMLFYSRRIGLNRGQSIPIEAGGRLTGRVGRYSLGMLNIQAGDEPVSGSPATNFSVLRLKRDLLRKSSIGAIFTGRSIDQRSAGSNEAFGVDATFAFYENLSISAYWARTRTETLTGEDTSYRAHLNYTGDRYGVQLEQLVVGDNFNPEVGFLRRDDMRRSFGELRFSPRVPSIERIRKLSWTASLGYVEDGAGRVETREWIGGFGIDFQNGDRFNLGYETNYEFLPKPFTFASGVTLPVGAYEFATARIGYNPGPGRTVSANISAEHGSFYSGHRTALEFSRGRLNLSDQFSLEPSISINWVDLAEGAFTTRLVGSRVTYTMTPMMFVSALLQYNSDSHLVSSNVRLRWEYRPGSELFVVYNDQQDTPGSRFPEFANRAFIVKINRLFRF